MSIVLSRVDERLVHGRVINDWIAEIRPSHLVIADDALVNDEFMSKIYRALLPLWLKAEILSCSSAAKYIKSVDSPGNRLFILAKSPRAFVALAKGGIHISEITLADKAFFKNKIEVSESNKRAANWLISAGIRLYAINSPLDRKEPIEPYQLERTI
ncbi:MAG: PTS sugar transporter subunit IIB [Oscillospiraceae bacterium]